MIDQELPKETQDGVVSGKLLSRQLPTIRWDRQPILQVMVIMMMIVVMVKVTMIVVMTMMVVVMVLVIIVVTAMLGLKIIVIVTGTEEERFQISYE